jgi:hypothetical protein
MIRSNLRCPRWRGRQAAHGRLYRRLLASSQNRRLDIHGYSQLEYSREQHEENGTDCSSVSERKLVVEISVAQRCLPDRSIACWAWIQLWIRGNSSARLTDHDDLGLEGRVLLLHLLLGVDEKYKANPGFDHSRVYNCFVMPTTPALDFSLISTINACFDRYTIFSCLPRCIVCGIFSVGLLFLFSWPGALLC